MLSPEEATALRYIKGQHNKGEEAVFYMPHHANCPEGSTWATHALLKRMHRKKLIALPALNEVPTVVWITTAGVEALEAANG